VHMTHTTHVTTIPIVGTLQIANAPLKPLLVRRTPYRFEIRELERDQVSLFQIKAWRERC
jgi:hypothetical protein